MGHRVEVISIHRIILNYSAYSALILNPSLTLRDLLATVETAVDIFEWQFFEYACQIFLVFLNAAGAF